MKRRVWIACVALLGWQFAAAQDSLKVWTLGECLDYALENNIQLRQSRNDYLSGIEDTEEAKAALFPSLTASVTQGFTNYPSSNATDRNSYTGTYGLNAGMTLYEGGKLRTAVKRQQVQNRIDALSVEESANDIRIAIVHAVPLRRRGCHGEPLHGRRLEGPARPRGGDVAGRVDQQGRFRTAGKPVRE